MIDSIIPGILIIIVPLAMYFSYRLGLRQGRRDGVSRHFAEKHRIESRRRALEEIENGPTPVIRMAVIKPTSRTRSQVDLDEENR